MNVLHIAWNEGLSAVYPAQVLRPMSLVAERTGAQIRLAVGSALGELLRPAGRRAWGARQAMAEQAFGLKIARLPTAPARLRSAFPDEGIACRRLRAMLPSAEPAILHCRGRAAAERGLAVRATRPDVRVIFDCRGWEGPELLHAHGFAGEAGAPADLIERSGEAEARQRRAARAADAVIVVSDAMRQVAVRQWGVEEGRLVVVPCCADAGTVAAGTRAAVRARLGLDSRLVVVYCGSLARYQAIDACLDVFEAIRRLRGDALFLGVTPAPARLAVLLRDRKLPDGDWRVVSAPHTEVPALLAAGDLALLLRQRSEVNEVASPVKFAEYLAAGLPVVISQGIGDYSEMVEREGLGCVLPPPPLPTSSDGRLRRFLEEYGLSAAAMRARCHANAERQLSAGRAADTLADLYRALWRDLTGAGGDERTIVAGRREAA